MSAERDALLLQPIPGQDAATFEATRRRVMACYDESPALDEAWSAAESALPHGWALWGVRFRAPSARRSRPRGQYEAWAGPIPRDEEPVAWPRPLRGLSGYSADSPAAALHALAAALRSKAGPEREPA